MTLSAFGVAKKKAYQQDHLEFQVLKAKQAKFDRGACKKMTIEKKLAKVNQALKKMLCSLIYPIGLLYSTFLLLMIPTSEISWGGSD